MHFQKKDKVYISIILALILILSFTSYQWYTYATNGAISSPIWEAGTQVETADYVIFKEGSTYYAKNGSTGEIEFSGTDAATVLESGVDALKGADEGYGRKRCAGLILIKDDLILKNSLDLTNIQGLTFVGYGRESGVKIRIQSNADMIFDLTNSRHVNFENLEFVVDSGYTPKTVFYLARGTSGASVGDSYFDNCHFQDLGGVTVGFIYNYGSELNTFRECAFRSKGRIVYMTADNTASISSLFSTEYSGSISTSMNRFVDCQFYAGDAFTEPILLSHGTFQTLFDRCFFGGGDQYIFHFNASSGNVYKPSITNSHFEAKGFTATGSSSTTREITGFTFTGNTIWISTDTVFWDFNKTNLEIHRAYVKNNRNVYSGTTLEFQAYRISYSEIDFLQEQNLCTLNVSSYLRWSKIVVKEPSAISSSGYVNVDLWYYSGYIKNSGTFTSISNGTYISHGLVGTPDVVTITLTVQGYAWIGATNSTHFQVYANVATISGYWYAEYKP